MSQLQIFQNAFGYSAYVQIRNAIMHIIVSILQVNDDGIEILSAINICHGLILRVSMCYELGDANHRKVGEKGATDPLS